MALKHYLTLGILTMAGAPMAFAQKAPEYADELLVRVEILKGDILFDACIEHGFADQDLVDCWGTALASNYVAVANPHKILPGIYYLQKTPEMLAADLVLARGQTAGSAQAPTALQQGVSDDDYRLALSDAAGWKSRHEALELQSGQEKALLESQIGTLTLERDNLAADLGLARNTLGYCQRIVSTMKDEAAKAPLDQAATEEILRSQGPPPVDLDDTDGVTFDVSDAELVFHRWWSLGSGVSILALAAALAWALRTRKGPKDPTAAKLAKASDRKSLRANLSALRDQIVPKKKPEPRREPPSGEAAAAYYASGTPKSEAPKPAAAPFEPPAPESAPAQAPLGLPDNRGYYYVEETFVFREEFLLKGHSPTRNTTVRFTRTSWQARLPHAEWSNLLYDYARRLVEQSDCFDRQKLGDRGFQDDPTIIFENLPVLESFTSRIPEETAEEAAP